ncbi:MAG: (d)CMP kinase [Pelagibacteraceae bacterium]|nr:(d)CMP kinase [Pelagibacteraceae bacterium]
MKKIITVDGPAGSGKEKISKYIARKYKLYHIDSGVFYRRLAYELKKNNIKTTEKQKIKKLIKQIDKLSLRKDNSLRKENIGVYASGIAKYKFVRDFINLQQRLATKTLDNKGGFVIDGRDIGSVVFKKAFLKLYIDVDVNIRAKRRYKQLIDNGEKSIYLKILEDIKLRDKKDKTRKNSPLVVPKGAKIIDNSLSFKNTIAQITEIIEGIN